MREDAWRVHSLIRGRSSETGVDIVRHWQWWRWQRQFLEPETSEQASVSIQFRPERWSWIHAAVLPHERGKP